LNALWSLLFFGFGPLGVFFGGWGGGYVQVFYAYFGTVFEESFSAPDQVAMHGGRGQPAADMHKRRKF